MPDLRPLFQLLFAMSCVIEVLALTVFAGVRVSPFVSRERFRAELPRMRRAMALVAVLFLIFGAWSAFELWGGAHEQPRETPGVRIRQLR